MTIQPASITAVPKLEAKANELRLSPNVTLPGFLGVEGFFYLVNVAGPYACSTVV